MIVFPTKLFFQSILLHSLLATLASFVKMRLHADHNLAPSGSAFEHGLSPE